MREALRGRWLTNWPGPYWRYVTSTRYSRPLCSNLACTQPYLRNIQVLFDLFLRSKLRIPLLWDTLRTYFRRWTHRVEAVLQWAETAAGLTERVVRGLYMGRVGGEGWWVLGAM